MLKKAHSKITLKKLFLIFKVTNFPFLITLDSDVSRGYRARAVAWNGINSSLMTATL